MQLPIKTYRVYLNQVNRTCITVKSTDKEGAISKAIKEWKQDYANASIEEIECEDDDD